MKFLLYEGRQGQQVLTEHTPEAWETLKNQMQEDNRCTFEEAVEDFGHDCLYGSFEYKESCYLSMDEGGCIRTLHLSEIHAGSLK